MKFPRIDPKADYDSNWSSHFNDRTLISVTQCWESSILFAARLGRSFQKHHSVIKKYVLKKIAQVIACNEEKVVSGFSDFVAVNVG